MMCSISLDVLYRYFCSKNILDIFGFDSSDVHSKIIKNLRKNFEFLSDALFEHGDWLQSQNVARSVIILEKNPQKSVNMRLVPGI